MQNRDHSSMGQGQVMDQEKVDYFARLSVNRREEKIKEKVGVAGSFFLGNLFNKTGKHI